MSREPVDEIRATDGRMLALVLRSDFSDYLSFPPTEAESGPGDGQEDRDGWSPAEMKAVLTDPDASLQLSVIRRPEGYRTEPHYHEVESHPSDTRRHQVLFCVSGRVEIGVYTTSGDHVSDVELEKNDLVLLTEGHSLHYDSPDSRVIEVKQGPVPDEGDKIDVGEK